MTSRGVLTLAGIVLVVAGLAAYRGARRVGPAAPPARPAAVALPQLIDFGRDT